MTKEEFKEACIFALLGEDEQTIINFINYWTEPSLKSSKVRFQSEKFFSIKRRFLTWKQNNRNWRISEKLNGNEHISRFEKSTNEIAEGLELIKKMHENGSIS